MTVISQSPRRSSGIDIAKGRTGAAMFGSMAGGTQNWEQTIAARRFNNED
jgi:hypothetical protein